MSDLFQLPKQVAISAGTVVPGAKLYFTLTTTTTPQNTYQDNARATPHANPVVADSNGVFAAIYLDPTLPDYRVRLTDANDVLIYQQDGVPSNQNTQQSVRLESTNPFVFLYDTDGTSGSRKYRIRAAGAAFEVQAANDAESVFTTILQFTGGVLYSNATEVAVTSSGSFTGTLTGMTGTVTGTFYYRKVNSLVHMWVKTNITGTSNTTALSVNGLPAAIIPASDKIVPCSFISDAGVIISATCDIGASISFTVDTVSGTRIVNGVFTNSGTKGVLDGWSVTYSVD